MKNIIERLNSLLYVSDTIVVKDVLNIYKFLIDDTNETGIYTTKIINVDVILEFAKSKNKEFVELALKIIGDMIIDKKDADRIINKGGLNIMKEILFEETDTELIKKDCWALSNIPMIKTKYAKMFLDENIVNKLLSIYKVSDISTKIEVGWALLNVCRCNDVIILDKLNEYNVFEILNDLLSHKIIDLTLAILNVLKEVFKQDRKYFIIMEKIGFVKKLEELQLHSNVKLHNQAINILEQFTYFYNTEEMEETP